MTSLADIGEVDSVTQKDPFADIAPSIAEDIQGLLGRDAPFSLNPFRLGTFLPALSKEWGPDSLANFKNAAFKFKRHIKMAQDVQSKQAVNRAFRWEIVTDDFNPFELGTEDLDFGDLYDRQVFCAATHDYLNSPDGINRIRANKDSCFNGDYCISRAGINTHVKDLISSGSFEFNRASDYRIPMSDGYSYHMARTRQRSLWAWCLQSMSDKYYAYSAAFFDKSHLYLYCARGDGLLMAWWLIRPFCPHQSIAIHGGTSCVIFGYSFSSPQRNIIIHISESQGDFTGVFWDSPPSWAIHDEGGLWDENKINGNVCIGTTVTSS